MRVRGTPREHACLDSLPQLRSLIFFYLHSVQRVLLLYIIFVSVINIYGGVDMSPVRSRSIEVLRGVTDFNGFVSIYLRFFILLSIFCLQIMCFFLVL